MSPTTSLALRARESARDRWQTPIFLPSAAEKQGSTIIYPRSRRAGAAGWTTSREAVAESRNAGSGTRSPIRGNQDILSGCRRPATSATNWLAGLSAPRHAPDGHAAPFAAYGRSTRSKFSEAPCQMSTMLCDYRVESKAAAQMADAAASEIDRSDWLFLALAWQALARSYGGRRSTRTISASAGWRRKINRPSEPWRSSQYRSLICESASACFGTGAAHGEHRPQCRLPSASTATGQVTWRGRQYLAAGNL